MARTWEEAVALVSVPGAPFELTDITADGVAMHAYLRAPQNMRQIFETARARGDQTFLVYEDERWSFADVDGQGGRARPPRWSQRYGVAQGRPGGDRDAQLSRVGGRLRRHPSIGAISVSSTPGGPRMRSTTRSKTVAPRC